MNRMEPGSSNARAGKSVASSIAASELALRRLTAGLIHSADASVYTSGLAPAKNLQLVTP